MLDEAIEAALDLSPRATVSPAPRSSTAAVRAEIDRRWEVKTSDVRLGHLAVRHRFPEDMVYRDVTDRFKDIEAQLQQRIVGRKTRSGPWLD